MNFVLLDTTGPRAKFRGSPWLKICLETLVMQEMKKFHLDVGGYRFDVCKFTNLLDFYGRPLWSGAIPWPSSSR